LQSVISDRFRAVALLAIQRQSYAMPTKVG
jgi:hypothetical protein